MLELVGPRWRREARLAVGEDHSKRDGATLTPAEFRSLIEPPDDPPAPSHPTPAPADQPAAPGDRTRDGLPAARARADVTVAPQPKPRSYTTMFRIARRHHDGPATRRGPTGLRRRAARPWRRSWSRWSAPRRSGSCCRARAAPSPDLGRVSTQTADDADRADPGRDRRRGQKLARIAQRVGVARTRLEVAYNLPGNTPAKQAGYASRSPSSTAGGVTQVNRVRSETPTPSRWPHSSTPWPATTRGSPTRLATTGRRPTTGPTTRSPRTSTRSRASSAKL